MTNKTLFQLSFPLLLNALLGMLVMLIDMTILSSYSEAAAAAVSIANQILLVAFDLSSLFATGAVVMVSRCLGKEDHEGARKMAETALLANGMVSICLGLFLFSFASLLIAAINCPAEIVQAATIYLRVGAFTILFNGVMLGATAALRGYGETKIIFALGANAYVLYLLAEVVFIFGWGPVPELGVFGSALATLLVRVLAVLVLFVVMTKRLRMDFQFWRQSWPETWHRIQKQFTLSWPSAFDNLAYGFYQIILVSYIASYNVAMILSRTFTLTLSALMTMILMSISQANEVMVGYRHGAGDAKEVKRCVMQSSFVSALLTTGFALALYYFSTPLVGLFTSQPEIHKLAKELLWITIFVQPFSALNTILFHSLRALGDVYVPVIATQVMMWGLSLPVAYVLTIVMDMGVLGLWYVLLMEEILKALFLFVRWQKRNW